MIAHMLAWSPFDPWHLLVIGLVALLLFGKRLPEVGRSLGRGIMEFKKGLRDVHEELNKEEEEKPRNKLQSPPEEQRRYREVGAPDEAATAKNEQK